MRIFESWYLGSCWNLRLVIVELWYLEGFWFVLEDFFLKTTFLHGEILEFSSLVFCLKICFNVNGNATVWHTPRCVLFVFFISQMVCVCVCVCDAFMRGKNDNGSVCQLAFFAHVCDYVHVLFLFTHETIVSFFKVFYFNPEAWIYIHTYKSQG
jgi:hypothetical protein